MLMNVGDICAELWWQGILPTDCCIVVHIVRILVNLPKDTDSKTKVETPVKPQPTISVCDKCGKIVGGHLPLFWTLDDFDAEDKCAGDCPNSAITLKEYMVQHNYVSAVVLKADVRASVKRARVNLARDDTAVERIELEQMQLHSDGADELATAMRLEADETKPETLIAKAYFYNLTPRPER